MRLFKYLSNVGLVVFFFFTHGVASIFSPDTLIIELDSYKPTFDFIPGEESYDLIADRLSCIENEIPLNLNTRVYSFINYFAIRNREYTLGVIERKKMYFPLFEEYLAKYGLPDELKYLSIVESGLEPRAISRAGAGGLWQFMPYTGRSYGLHKDFYIDERFDPEKATEAACKYLKMLYNMFGDWELALAAYNSGPGNVRKAIRRSGYKKTFWEVYRYLPRETRSYLPQFVAITYILKYADDHNLSVDNYLVQLKTDTLMVNKFLNLKLLAEAIDVCYEDLEKINPAVKRFALPETIKKYPINIPLDKIDYVRQNRQDVLIAAAASGQKELQQIAKNTPGSTYGRDKVVYRVKSGDVLGTIAQKYHVRISDLRNWNNINGNLIRVGQRLKIWVLPGRNTTTLAQKTSPTSMPKQTLEITQSGKIYSVQPGDTLWDISKMYNGLTVEKLKKLNKLRSNKIVPGQKLIVG